jgi:hypothetical protein
MWLYLRTHVGHCEEYLDVSAFFGDGKLTLQGWIVVLVIIPPNVHQSLPSLPWGLMNPIQNQYQKWI